MFFFGFTNNISITKQKKNKIDMVNLTDFETYFISIKQQIGVKKIFFLTNEADISSSLNDIKPEEQPFMLVIIPSSKTSGSSQDDVSEINYCLLYILSKEERGQIDTFIIQKNLQPILESCKRKMIQDKDSCGLLRNLDVSSFHSDPESKLFSRATGWSLSFEFTTDL